MDTEEDGDKSESLSNKVSGDKTIISPVRLGSNMNHLLQRN